jgi:S-adenosylmethionine-diacylglycerol 3-amino-3-carboxypropyl transferase
MISSAGCNALDYLQEDPASIHCVDVNYRQNALVELKKALLQVLDAPTLFQVFGKGCHPEMQQLLSKTKSILPGFAYDFWQSKLHYFNGKGPRKNFYHYGTSGTFAWMASQYLKARPRLNANVRALLDAEDLDSQKRYYEQVEGQLTNKLMEWFVNRHLVMSLVGVPRSQQELFKSQFRDGTLGYIKECLRQVFTTLPIQENYFWRLYLEGAYTPTCCPAYLQADTQPLIRERANCIQTHTQTLCDFLEQNPGNYSQFILLDHQDWLAANNREVLEQEWRLILKNSRPGARILLRSAAEKVNFFPEFIHQHVQFDEERASASHPKDRVGTYASVYLGYVEQPLT